MRLKNYKIVLMTLLPLLLLALSPTRAVVCTEKMQCSSCYEMTARDSSLGSQITSFNSCCVSHFTEGFTTLVSLQKIEDITKKKNHAMVFANPYVNSSAQQNFKDSKISAFYSSAFFPHPPLVLIKSSLVI